MIRPRTCPICEREPALEAPEAAHFPFCSLRCKQADLYRWMHGDYAIVDPLRLHEDDPQVVDDEPQ